MIRVMKAGWTALAILALAGIMPFSTDALAAIEPFVSSPDGRIELSFGLDEAGVPLYQVALDGRMLLAPSPVGLQTSVAFWDRDLSLVETSAVEEVVDEYRLLHGKQRDVRYVTNRRTVRLAERVATVVGVLIEVPVMLSLVAFANRTQHWFPAPKPETAAPVPVAEVSAQETT